MTPNNLLLSGSMRLTCELVKRPTDVKNELEIITIIKCVQVIQVQLLNY